MLLGKDEGKEAEEEILKYFFKSYKEDVSMCARFYYFLKFNFRFRFHQDITVQMHTTSTKNKSKNWISLKSSNWIEKVFEEVKKYSRMWAECSYMRLETCIWGFQESISSFYGWWNGMYDKQSETFLLLMQ
jgi:hypothetical protein